MLGNIALALTCLISSYLSRQVDLRTNLALLGLFIGNDDGESTLIDLMCIGGSLL